MNKLLLSASLASLVALTGCATTGGFAGGTSTASPEARAAQADRQQANRRAAGRGFLQGCAGGALTGLLFGNREDALKGCVAGGVVVGSVAWFAENNRQLQEAEAVAAQARALGATANVKTTNQQVRNEQGVTESVPTLEELVLKFPPQAFAARSDSTKELIRRAAAMADASKTPVTITAHANSQANSQWLANQVRANVKNPQTTVVEGGFDASEPTLVLSPIPSL